MESSNFTLLKVIYFLESNFPLWKVILLFGKWFTFWKGNFPFWKAIFLFDFLLLKQFYFWNGNYFCQRNLHDDEIFHYNIVQKCLNMKKMKFNSYSLDLFTISYLFTFCYNQLFVYILFQLAVYLNDEIWFLCNPLFVVIL